jgi:hypothetical protein
MPRHLNISQSDVWYCSAIAPPKPVNTKEQIAGYRVVGRKIIYEKASTRIISRICTLKRIYIH